MPTREEIIANLYKLDPDELAVLYWTAKGESAAGIGKRLFKSEGTARSKRTEVYRKIGLFELHDEDKKPHVRQYYAPVMLELGMTDRNIQLPDREPSKEETKPEEEVSEGLAETPREENIQIPDRELEKKETEPEEVTKKPAELPGMK